MGGLSLVENEALFLLSSQALGAKILHGFTRFQAQGSSYLKAYQLVVSCLHWKFMGGASCSRAPKVDFLIRVYYGFHDLGLIS